MRLPQRSDVTERIVATDLCTGCGACAALAPKQISMGLDGEGFLRPTCASRLSKRDARQVMDVCPGGGQVAPDPVRHEATLWGGYHEVFQGWAADPDLRFAGASGGGLSALCLSLLESGKVDGVVQVAADPRNPMGNRTVVSRTRADILDAAASRYAPSAPLCDVPALLETGEVYAFVGKPCDVAGLRKWAAIDARIDRSFPVMVSFFCAGVPSAKGAVAIAEGLGVRADDVSAFRFRGQGWPGRCEVTDRSGETRSMTYHESWGGVLSKHVQPRCRICADGTGLAADVVFADAWETDAAGYPLFEEQEGRSLVLARSDYGAELVSQAVASGALVVEPFDIGGIEAMQAGQVRRRRELLGRLAGRVLAGYPVPRYRRMGIWRSARATPVLQTIRAALGMARRCVLRRRMSG